MISIPGIKSILKCDKGTLATTPTTPVYIGLRDKAKMTFPPYKATKDFRNRQFRNKLQAMVDYETRQATLQNLNANFKFMNLGCDVQVISEKQSVTTGSEDVFKFNSTTLLLGLGFEYMVSLEKRSIKETLKGAADFDVVKTMIDAADSNAAVTVAGITHPGGEDWSMQRRVNILNLESPAATALIAAGEFEDFKFSIKSVEDETGDGQTTIKSFLCRLEATGKDASVTKLIAQLAKNINSSVLFKLDNGSSHYDAFDFAAGVLTPVEEPELSDDKRNLKVVYEGEVRPYEFDFKFGDGVSIDNGGGFADTVGALGGTVKIGY